MPNEPRLKEFLEVKGLGEARILSFFEYKTEEFCNYFMITQGESKARTSIFVFEEDLQRKEMPALQEHFV